MSSRPTKATMKMSIITFADWMRRYREPFLTKFLQNFEPSTEKSEASTQTEKNEMLSLKSIDEKCDNKYQLECCICQNKSGDDWKISAHTFVNSAREHSDCYLTKFFSKEYYFPSFEENDDDSKEQKELKDSETQTVITGSIYFTNMINE